MCRTDAYGFPSRHRYRATTCLGCATGDMSEARIPAGKHAGHHVGRLTIRQRASVHLNGLDVHPKYLTVIHTKDGYAYSTPV